MRYIKEEPFINVKGTQLQIIDEVEDEGVCETCKQRKIKMVKSEGTTKSVLLNLATQYNYNPQLGLALGNAELRKFNKAIDVLEKGELVSGYLVFETEDFEVLKKTCVKIGEIRMARNSPKVEDILNAALDKMPKNNNEKETEKKE